MAIHRTTRKPDTPAQAEAQEALRAALAAIGQHKVKTIAVNAGIAKDTLYSHLTTARKYPLRVPAGRLRAVAQSFENQIAALVQARDRMLAAADALDAERAATASASDSTAATAA